MIRGRPADRIFHNLIKRVGVDSVVSKRRAGEGGGGHLTPQCSVSTAWGSQAGYFEQYAGDIWSSGSLMANRYEQITMASW